MNDFNLQIFRLMIFKRQAMIRLRIKIALLVKYGKVGLSMMEFTWKVFSQTGNIDTYLLFKEMQKETQDIPGNQDEELAEVDFPIS